MQIYRFFTLLAFFIIANVFSSVTAQFQFDFQNSIPVSINGELKEKAFFGGFNNPQFSTIDFDFDGDDDLVVFDRSSSQIMLFENILENGIRKYQYVYNGKQYFPADINYRMALVDYDNDGRKDLFVAATGGTMVYRNTGTVQNGLSWELVSPLLKSNYFHDISNLYISTTDIPAYIDIDNDGDIDILTYHISGQRMEYHQNQSMELYGIPDSLIFELKNECWGKFKEGAHSFEIVLSPNEAPCDGNTGVVDPKSGEYRHSGGTVLALDYDNNGVKDLILGNISYRNLNLLINGGTAVNMNSAMISQDINFPSNSDRVNVLSFPASFYEDVDFDNVKDLVVAPNDKNNSSNKQSVWFYKNIGTNTQPEFSFVSTDYIQSQGIDVGMGSVPIVTDITNDGLQDLIVGNYFEMNADSVKKSTLHLFENQGTATSPMLALIDTNFLDLPALNIGFRVIPTFGDLNNDGNKDVILGSDNGKLYILTATSSQTFSPIAPLLDATSVAIKCEGGASPQLVDVNEDGLLDVLIGTKNGKIHYYENTGSVSTYQFTLVTKNFGNVNVSENYIGYATPHLFQNDNEWFLLCGSANGKLHFYKNIIINNQLQTTFETISDNFLGIDTRGYSAPFISDIDNDGRFNLFIGMELGGLWHFEHDPNSHVQVNDLTDNNATLTIYPNPSNGTFHIDNTSNAEIKAIQILDINGRVIAFTWQHKTLQLQNASPGVYIVKISTDQHPEGIVKRIFVQ